MKDKTNFSLLVLLASPHWAQIADDLTCFDKRHGKNQAISLLPQSLGRYSFFLAPS
jgi:hypothetical protein